MPTPTLAGTTPALFQSFPRTGDPDTINFVATGNTLRAGNNAGGNTSAASLISGLSGNPVDAGSNSATVSGIPAGSTILAAYLYWAGSGSTTDYTVTLNGISVTAPANRQYTETYTVGAGNVLAFFSGAADVTSIVTGNGTYTFGGLNVTNVNVGTVTYFGSQATTAGWSLLVVYSNPSETNRVINVFEGFQAFRNTSINLSMNNFRIPSTNINGKFAVLTWEGDPDAPSNTGETLGLTPGTTLSDACDTNGNQYNSTINTLFCTGNAATDDVFYGVDFDTYDVSSMLTSGETTVTTNYTSGNDLVLLSAQVLSVATTPVSDLSISKAHNGTFGYGDNGSYTLTVTNNGPATTAGTTTVTDTLPAGETFVSGTGTGWSCSAVGQAVTCTSTAAVTASNTFSPITLTVAVATSAGTSLANTATVATTNFDNTSGNNSSTDTVSNAGGTLVHPDLTSSTKTVADTNGGNVQVGDTLQYTITLTESANVAASTVSVTDDIPANLSGFTASAVTVTGSSSIVTNSSTNTGGANGDGLVSISNITVPAGGSVTIVFSAQVAAGTANCTTIDNTATVTTPGGSAGNTSILLNGTPTETVMQSACTSNGNKILYVYDNTGGTVPPYLNLLNRIPQTQTTGTGITVNGGTSHTWALSPALAKNLVLSQGNITVSLVETNTNAATTTRRATTVSLLDNGTVIATSASTNTSNTNAATVINYTVTITAAMVTAGTNVILAGHTLSLTLNNNATANNHILVSQKSGALTTSRIGFATTTVINVDSVTPYSAPYSSSSQSAPYAPGSTVYLCAVISDPFGSYDATSATVNIRDANGVLQQTAAMTAMGASDCTNSAGSTVPPTADEAYEYAYLIPNSGVAGNWTATVTGNEGTENNVSNTNSGSFAVHLLPSLLIVKSVSVVSDPTGTAIKHSVPGATMQYLIQVQNTGPGAVDGGTFVITDPVPTNTALSLPAKPPFTFTDGSPSSGLSVSANDGSIAYSNNGGSTYVYVPSCTRPCTDAAITNFKITLNGSMNGKTGATAPSFSITYNVVIQ